uniref:Sphingomyelin phosphodiesterase D LiSicTox-alphaIA1bii n=1 Tax=Aceria tosichella TaxID=561515 RepID=A0A6G1S5W2_9ACAR
MTTRILALAICMGAAFGRLKFQAEASPITEEQNLSSTSNQAVNLDDRPDIVASTATALTYDLKPYDRQDHRRPIWAIAHMVNSIKELGYRLEKGANGVEADVTFSTDGEPMYTYHGPPCDCWRHCNQQENFNDYLSFIREISIDTTDGIGQNFTMLFLDLKLGPLDQQAKVRAGQELAKSVMNNLYPNYIQQVANGQKFRLILSINHVNDVDLVRNFIHTLEINNSSYLLHNNIGFDVGMNDDLQSIESMWHKLSSTNYGTSLNIWQGDGLTNCLSPFYNLERLTRALTKRDSPQGFPAKVYHWTIDLHDRMRESLLMGVDAIMTNHPERITTLLTEPMMARDFRLATRNDDPFRKLTKRQLVRSNEAARYQRSAHTQNGGLLYSLVDVLASLLNYVKEIPFLSYPAALISRRSSASTLTKHRIVGKPVAPSVDTATSPTMNITRVAFQSEPAYNVIPTTTADSSVDQERQAVTQLLDITIVPHRPAEPAFLPEYEGPSWYTSLLSSVLVSIMRVLMPVN